MESQTVVQHSIPGKWKRLRDYGRAAGFACASFLSGASLHTLYCSQLVATRWMMTVRVVRDLPVTRAVAPMVASITINGRIYAGLVLVGIVAPLSACIHMLPGMKELVSEDWFYQCWYNLWLVLGPYFFSLCVVIAAFLWIPPITKRIKFSRKDLKFQITRMLSIPAGIIIGKIVWLIFCDSNADFERIGHPLFFIGGIVVGYAILRVLDYLVWRQEHSMNALIDSLEGLYRKVELDFKTRDEMAAPYWEELRQFHSKY